ncbi:MAG: hypothetical protein SPL22_08690 [Treponema sp.]|nr:hypothetical protein [Treponema sp.]MDY6397796.1 hypothetical protein [Treponema sp.]
MNILELIKHPLFTGLDEKSLPEAFSVLIKNILQISMNKNLHLS